MTDTGCRRGLKILGGLSIAESVMTLLLASLFFFIGANGFQFQEVPREVGIIAILTLGVYLLFCSFFTLMEGMFSFRAADDLTKIRPVWIMTLINAIVSGVVLGLNVMDRGSVTGLYPALAILVINWLFFFMANQIRTESIEIETE